jgi:uncharacterized protein YcnI
MRIAVLGAAASLVLLATPALAHVTVQGPGATQGGFTKLTFRVPTEKDVNTTKLEITFPTDAPLAFASIKPHAGWTYKVVKAKPAAPLKDDDGNTIDQVVSTITWTATAGGIKPGEFDEFEVSAGPLPKKDTMTFKALQTYADGDVVRWIEGPEAEHPAPVLKLAASSTPTASAAPSVTASAEEDDDQAGNAAAIGLGSVAVLLSLIALARTLGRRKS